MLIEWVDAAILWVHLFSAVLFVGGSFFMWLVVEPVSYRLGVDEAARTQLVGRLARRFGQVVTPLLVVLVVTGLYNASWYLPTPASPLSSLGGQVLIAKSGLVVLLVVLIYVHGFYFGRKISRLAREGQVEALRQVRRKSRLVAYANLGLMLVVLALAVALQLVG